MLSKQEILSQIRSHADSLGQGFDLAALPDKYSFDACLEALKKRAATAAAVPEASSSRITSLPVRITKSGNYALCLPEGCQDRVLVSQADGVAAISIYASDVTLDLNGCDVSIGGIPHDCPTIAIGHIGLFSAIRNVTVRNGRILGATTYGMLAQGVDGLTLSDLTVQVTSEEKSESGIHAGAVEETAIPEFSGGIFAVLSDNVTIERCTVSRWQTIAKTAFGIATLLSKTVCVSGCSVKNLTNLDGVGAGYFFAASWGITCTRSAVDTLHTHYLGISGAAGRTAIGFLPTCCADVTMAGCSARDIFGCCDDAHGASVFLCFLVRVSGLTVDRVVDGDCKALTGAKATGLEVYGWDVTVTGSMARSIHAIVPQDLQSAGFSAWGKAISFTDCRAVDVLVLDKDKVPDTTKGYGVGFGWAPDPRDAFYSTNASGVIYAGCLAEGCQVGFDTWKHVASIWDGVMVCDCGIALLQQPDPTTRTMVMNKCSEAPDGVSLSRQVMNTAKDNLIGAPQVLPATSGVAFPPVCPENVWSVPRLSVPGLFSMQPAFDKEWWYYVGTVETADGLTFSLQFQLLRARAIPGVTIAMSIVGIGWREAGVSNYLFAQSYGLGASAQGPLSRESNALVVPTAYDGRFTATYQPGVEVISWAPELQMQAAPSDLTPYRIAYTCGASLGQPGSFYTLQGAGTGNHRRGDTANKAAMSAVATPFSLTLDLTDVFGTFMEGLAGYSGSALTPDEAEDGRAAMESYECAQPRMAVNAGFIQLGGQTHTVRGGTLWMDRQMVTAQTLPDGSVASKSGSRIPQTNEELCQFLKSHGSGMQALYRGNWLALNLDSGISLALAVFWPSSTPQWIVGSKVGVYAVGGFGNLLIPREVNGKATAQSVQYLAIRTASEGQEWGFDINILLPDETEKSPHWTSGDSGHTYATALQVEFAEVAQASGVPKTVYLFAVSDICENALPTDTGHFFEGAARIYGEIDEAGNPKGRLIGTAYIEEMGY